MSFLFLSSSSVTSKPPYSGSPRTALRSAASWAGARRSGRRLSRYLPVEMIRADRRSPSSLGAGRVTSNPGRQDLVYLLFTCPANTDRVSIDGRLYRLPGHRHPSPQELGKRAESGHRDLDEHASEISRSLGAVRDPVCRIADRIGGHDRIEGEQLLGKARRPRQHVVRCVTCFRQHRETQLHSISPPMQKTKTSPSDPG